MQGSPTKASERRHQAGDALAGPDKVRPRRTKAVPQEEPQRLFHPSGWRVVQEQFPWLERRLSSNANGVAEEKRFRVSGCTVSIVVTTPGKGVHPSALPAIGDAGRIRLLWPICGRLIVSQDGRDALIAEKDVTVVDASRPYRIQSSDEAIIIALATPHDWFLEWDSISQDICATHVREPFTARAMMGAILANIGMPEDASGVTAAGLRWMLHRALANQADATSDASLLDHRYRTARRAIGKQMSDSDLNADRLAASLCLSRRSLYLLFEKYGTTPSAVIREMRLEKAAAALRSSRGALRRKITDIAFDVGFKDYATFSRSFKQRFGLTPIDFKTLLRSETRSSMGRETTGDWIEVEALQNSSLRQGREH